MDKTTTIEVLRAMVFLSHVRRLAPLLFEGQTVSDITAFKAKSVRRGELFSDITALEEQSIQRGAIL